MTDPAARLHVLRGPRVPETAGHPFLCEHFRGTLTGGECLRRQTLRTKAMPQAKNQAARVPPHLEYCAGGKCDQGAEIAKKFPDWRPEERSQPKLQAQWDAKRRSEAALPPMRGLAERPAPTEPVEQLKREVADLVLKRKKPTWREWKEQKDRERAQEPAPELDQVEHEPHPLSNRGMEESMAEVKADAEVNSCAEEGCNRKDRLTKGLCGMHYQRARTAAKSGKPRAAVVPRLVDARGKPSLTGQDEFDLMIQIRDSFRKLSEPAKRYVLDALKGAA